MSPRENFIDTLHETADIAIACEQFAAASVLKALTSAMLVGVDQALCEHVAVFAKRISELCGELMEQNAVSAHGFVPSRFLETCSACGKPRNEFPHS